MWRIRREAFDGDPRLRRIRFRLEERIEERMLLTDAAALAQLSPKYFSTWFRQNVGVRFNVWVNYVRIERAKELLGVRRYTIAEVARRVGYRDLRTFERAFKRLNDCSPRSWLGRRPEYNPASDGRARSPDRRRPVRIRDGG